MSVCVALPWGRCVCVYLRVRAQPAYRREGNLSMARADARQERLGWQKHTEEGIPGFALLSSAGKEYSQTVEGVDQGLHQWRASLLRLPQGRSKKWYACWYEWRHRRTTSEPRQNEMALACLSPNSHWVKCVCATPNHFKFGLYIMAHTVWWIMAHQTVLLIALPHFLCVKWRMGIF